MMRKLSFIAALLLVAQVFAQSPTTVGPSNGSLIILGSGYDSTVLNKFVQHAGGHKTK